MCEAGPSVSLIPVELMAARALLRIKMHAIFIYLIFSHDIQLIAAGYNNNKKCEEGEFQKWNACTSQRKNFSLFCGLQLDYEN